MNASRGTVLACLATLAGCATQPAQDPAAICYLDGKPYSEGAVVDGKVCAIGGPLIYEDGHRAPLEWVPLRRKN
ncbi:hypothetical protein [Agrobacterium tumefaciens]|uniref:hypothetical protein n=1 Tax=Agrobacterium tumefaciens TaxID=358 RepID=UPI003BA002BB